MEDVMEHAGVEQPVEVTEDALLKRRDSYADDLQENLPSLNRDAAEQYAQVLVGLSVAFPDRSQDELKPLVQNVLQYETAAKQDWALAANAALLEKARPAYEQAVNAGVDPVVVVMATVGLPKKEARGLVKVLKSESTQA